MGQNWPILTYVRKWPRVVPVPPILPSFWVPGTLLDLWSIGFHENSNLSHVEVVLKGLYLPIFGLFCPFCSLLGHFNGIFSTDPQFFGLKLVTCWKFCMIFWQGDIHSRAIEVGRFPIYEAKCWFSRWLFTSLEYGHTFAHPKLFLTTNESIQTRYHTRIFLKGHQNGQKTKF